MTTYPQPIVLPAGGSLLGRCYWHPSIDYLVIGGGLSIPFVIWAALVPGATPQYVLPYMLVFNFAHFAASTVRLYTKPGQARALPFLSYAFPVVVLVIATAGVAWPNLLGERLWQLYRTWSPFHYAAQAYGLSMIYCYRSSVRLHQGERRALWWSSMLPFLWAFVSARDAGLEWFLPIGALSSPYFSVLRNWSVQTLGVAAFAAPILFFGTLYARGQRVPLIAPLLLGVNGMWWVILGYTDAFFWATIFHSIQYLAIVTLYHAADQTKLYGSVRTQTYHWVSFYAACLVLGIGLFVLWPILYVLMGFHADHANMAVLAVINVHHFIVDGFIWKTRGGKGAVPVAETAIA